LSKILLLISKDPTDHAFCTEVASSSSLSLKSVSQFTEGALILAQQDVGALFVAIDSVQEYQEFETAVQEKVGLYSEKVEANRIHIISSQSFELAPYLVQSPLFGHFVYRKYGNIQASGKIYARTVVLTQTERAFGLGPLLSPGAKVQVVRLESSDKKQSAVEAVKTYLIAAKFQSRMASVIANAVDEILMNAIFDAPIDDLGRPLLSTTARTSIIKLENRSAVELHVGFDNETVGLSAIDLYGSIDKQKLLQYISKVYTSDEYRVRSNIAGAGIGLATVLHTGGSLVFVSESRVKSQVTVLFKRTDNFRAFKEQFRFISTQFYF
jgi:hypothetical protein